MPFARMAAGCGFSLPQNGADRLRRGAVWRCEIPLPFAVICLRWIEAGSDFRSNLVQNLAGGDPGAAVQDRW
jgi:hypothetical protein